MYSNFFINTLIQRFSILFGDGIWKAQYLTEPYNKGDLRLLKRRVDRTIDQGDILNFVKILTEHTSGVWLP